MFLSLKNTKVTNAGVMDFQYAVPNCYVHWTEVIGR